MEKKPYYVSVQSGTVLSGEGEAPFEFEIVADEREVERLIEMFEEKEDHDTNSYIRAHTPAVPYRDDVENDAYDASLTRIYERIHELGTPETQRHIEEMGVLRGIRRDSMELHR